MVEIVKLAGLILSFAGWMYGAKRLLRVDFCFIPAFVFSAVALVVYFGGIFAVLYPAALAVYLGGLVLFGHWAVRQKEKARTLGAGLLHLREVCFGAGTVLFLSILPGTRLDHYDNFSHWGIVVKLMLSTDAFPTAQTGLIDFLNYPLGTSSFLYYVCRFSTRSEGMMLLAQGVLIFAFFYAIFGAVRHTKCFLLYAVLGAGMSILSFFNVTIRISNLLVDFLLPVIALGCWAAILRYADQPEKLLPLLGVYQGLLLVVKSTGAIYLGFTLCLFLLRVPRAVWNAPSPKHGRGRCMWAVALGTAATLAFSALSWLAWQYHTKTAFPNATHKFDVSEAGVAKSAEEMRAIAELFVRTSLDLTTRPAQGFVAANVLMAAAVVFFWWKGCRGLGKLAGQLALLDGMTVAYYVGILAMYLFSMPSDEALVLAGFDRYACSIIVLLMGGVVLAVEQQAEAMLHYAPDGTARFEVFAEKQFYQQAVMVSMAVMLGLLTSEYNGTLYTARQEGYSLTQIMQSVTGDRWYENGTEDTTRYLLYGSDYDGQMTSYYFQYVARYYLYAPHVDAVCSFYEDNLENLLSGYECLVVIEPDAEEQRMLKKHFGVDGTAGFYRIDTAGSGVALEAAEQE